jgi:hypothetical protein
VEVNILSERERPYQFGNRSILANILIPHKGYKNGIPIYWEIRQSSIPDYPIGSGIFSGTNQRKAILSFPDSSRVAF